MSNPSFSIADIMDRGLSAATLQREFVSDQDSIHLHRAQLTGEAMVSAFKDTFREAVVVDRFRDILDGIDLVKTPLQVATTFINAKYAALSSAAGFLGSPTTAVTICPDGVGYFRHFQGGSIYWHPNAGAHEVHGLIRQRWAEMGWETSFLGYPKTDETVGGDPQSAGRFNHFQGGSIYWHPSAGTFEVHGAIRAKYLALGAESSVLGYPSTDETSTPDRRGRFNHFQAGSIYWTADTGAYEVHGLIRQLWAAQGWERNPKLGYPISDELIPDRRIGHVHPETQRKPIVAMPLDVVKLPFEARSPRLTSVVTGAPLTEFAGLSGGRTAVSRSPVVREAVTDLTTAGGAATNRVNNGTESGNGFALARGAIHLDTERQPGEMASSTAERRETATVTLENQSFLDSNAAIASRGVFGTRPEINVDLVDRIGAQPKSSSAPEKSLNRFGDFENGVLFWHRNATQAITLSPWLQSADGEKTHLTPQDIIDKISPGLLPGLGTVAGVTFAGIGFASTTGYWFDGVGSHNRKHRFSVTLMGKRVQRVGFSDIEIPMPVMLEIQLEVAFEPINRKVVGFVTDWSLPGGTGGITASATLEAHLHRALDGLLWKAIPLLAIDDTEAGQPFAILSVKTMIDGQVFIFIEPRFSRQDLLLSQIDRSVLAVDFTP
ncbi:MAG: hypothetical protein WBA99_02190 [Nodosilinea sp.]